MSRVRGGRAAPALARASFALGVAAVAAVAPAGAQIPGDTVLADTLPPDTVDYTARFLEAQAREGVRVPAVPRLESPGPRPPLTRVVFDRDSIEWGPAETLGDLLLQVPGVYLWRGGFVGRPEPVSFQGRGAASAEYFLDGLPFVPAGLDSVSVDPALFALSFLDRIEVERWPGRLRVWLYTRRHDRLAPRSRIAVARGDRNFARYQAELERRFGSGLGFAIAADFLNSPTASGLSSDYSNTAAWVQASYVRSPRFSAQVQLVQARPDRAPYVLAGDVASDTIGLGYDAKRTDAQVRLAFGGRSDGTGPRFDVVYGRTTWGDGAVDQAINVLGGQATLRRRTAGLGVSAYYRSRWTPLDARASASWSPLGALTAFAELVHRSHVGGRSSDWAVAAAGLQLPLGFALTGSARVGAEVAVPSVRSDTAQDLRDLRVAAGWERRRVGAEVGYAHTGAFAPPAYPEFLRIPAFSPTPATDWLTVRLRVAPLQWLTLETQYADPVGLAREGAPPTHSVSSVTVRSKFLRTFRSGIFDLKLRFGMESWGDGVIGRDGTGGPVVLRGATHFRALIQLQIQSFSIYWDRANLTATELPYVPGFRLPNYGTTFGVRWEFLN